MKIPRENIFLPVFKPFPGVLTVGKLVYSSSEIDLIKAFVYGVWTNAEYIRDAQPEVPLLENRPFVDVPNKL